MTATHFVACSGDCESCDECTACTRQGELTTTIDDVTERLRKLASVADDISSTLDSSDGVVEASVDPDDEDSLVIELQTIRRKSVTSQHRLALVATAGRRG